MTVTQTRSSSSAAVMMFPHVNLLPPEARAKRALARAKPRLAVFVGAVALVTMAAFALAMVTDSGAARELAAAQDANASLIQQQAQFAEVPQVRGEIAEMEAARAQVMSREVLWRQYLGAIQAVAPDGITISSLTATPLAASDAAGSTVLDPGAATITFVGQSKTVPSTVAWIDALDSIPGFSGATFSSLQATDGASGSYYQLSSTVQVTAAAFAHRFDGKTTP